MVAAAATLVPTTLATSPASAAVYNCSKGYNTAQTAWGNCRSGAGWWSLTVQCYYAPQRTSWGYGPGSIYASCPSRSYITRIILNVQH